MRYFITLIVSFIFAFLSFSASADTINVITNNHDFHLKPIFEKFEQEYGHDIKVLYIEDGILNRIKMRPTESDVIVTKSTFILPILKKEGIIKPINSKYINNKVDEQYIDDYWKTYSLKSRVIYYSKNVDISELNSYMDLADEKWKGKIAIRSGYNNYNLDLFGNILLDKGEEETFKFIKNFKSNLCRKPQGNDRAQAKAIYDEKAELAVASTHYMGIMKSRSTQKEWANACKMFFPNQESEGSYVIPNSIAVTKDSEAIRNLVDFFFTKENQKFISDVSFEYPVRKVELPEVVENFGKEQLDGKRPKFKMNDPEEVAKCREKVIMMLNNVGFDK